MEEFVLSPPQAILWVVAGIVLVAAASIALKKGDLAKKAIGFGITLVVAVGILFFVYRPVTITVDEEAIAVDGAGGLVLPWEAVESAVFETDLRSSPFRPTVRRAGVAIGGYRTGRFLLSNGEPARVFMVQDESAVVIRTAEQSFIFAPHDADAMAEAVDRYRVYEEER